MKIYAINLPHCQDRRENILRECARFNLEVEIYPGMDGRDLTVEQRRAQVYKPERNPLGNSELGCTMSHLSVYRNMIEKNVPIALILEDDSVFNMDPRPVLEELEQWPMERPDVYLLTHRNNTYINSAKPAQIGGMGFYQGWNAFGGNGYVVSRKTAENILRFQTPLKVMCDDWKIFLLAGLLSLWICEKEIVGLRRELAEVSLLDADRLSRGGRGRKQFFRKLRKEIPVRLRAKYLLAKILRWRSFRHHRGNM